MVKMALGAALTGMLMAVIGLAIVLTGRFDVRATTQHSQPVAWAIHHTMMASARRGASDLPPPPPLTPAQVEAGFVLYDTRCAMCHGGPGVPRAGWVTGLNPSPPFLLDAARTWTPQELEWIVANGIKMTAMPAWKLSMNRQQVRDTVAFLRAPPFLDAARYARMRAGLKPDGAGDARGPAIPSGQPNCPTA